MKKNPVFLSPFFAAVFAASFAFCGSNEQLSAQTTTNVFFFDDFNRANGADLGSATNTIDGTSYLWTKGGVAPSSTLISNNTLFLGTGGLSGRDWALAQLTNTSGFNTTYSSSTASTIEWYFNMRTSRSDPSGFDAGGYGSAFILGASSSSLTNSGTTGYAVVIGQSGATDPLRLVSFANGITNNAGLTTIITATNVGADIGAQFLSLKLSLDVSTSLWTLTGTTNSSFVDPWTNPSMLSLGAASNSTYTSSSLSYVGAFWNHATAGADNTTYDNFRIASITTTNVPSIDTDWAGGSGSWSTGFSSAVTNGASLVFSGAGGTAANDLSSPLIRTIVFSNNAGSYTITGNGITVSNGIVNNSVNTQIFSNAVTLGTAQIFNAAAGAIEFAGNIDNGGNTLTVSGSSATAVTGSMSGAGGLIKSGAATLTLSAANTFGGAVALNGGTLVLTNGSALADTAAVTLANAVGVTLQVAQSETIGSLAGGGASGGTMSLGANTLSLKQSANSTYAGTISGKGTLAKSGSGTLALGSAGAVGAEFGILINEGTIDLNRGGSAISGLLGVSNRVTLNGGTIGFSASSGGNGAITFGGIEITADSTVLISRTSATNSHSTTITAPLFFTNGATLNIAYNANVNAGTTTFAGATNVLNSDATLALSNYNVTIANAIGESGGSRSLTKSGTGTLALTGDNTYTGNTVISSGAVSVGVGASSGSIAGNVQNEGQLIFNRTGQLNYGGTISGGGGVAKSGSGTVTLAGPNTYIGTTTVIAGMLLVNGDQSSALGTFSISAGASAGGSGTIGGAVEVNGTLAPGSSIASLATGALSFSNGSTFAVELNSSVAPSVGADLVKASGNLSLQSPGTVTLTLADIAGTPAVFTEGTKFTLINYSGTWNSGLFTYNAASLADEATFDFGLNSWRIDYNATVGGSNFADEYSGDNFVNIEVIPEPSTYALLSLAAAGLGAHLIRRRRR